MPPLWTYLMQGDCLELMSKIPDKAVNMVLSDLPYGTTQNKWDSVIPFEPLWREYERICTGAIVLTAAQPFTSALVMSRPELFRYDWTWRKQKGTGHLNAKKMPMRNKEDILVFGKSIPTYNPQMIEGKPYTAVSKGSNRKSNSQQTENYGVYSTGKIDNNGERYPVSVLDFQTVGRGGVHPTQKPVDLFEYLIKTYTNENEVVLDNTMGSGTTGVASVNLNRNFVGIELNADYYAIAQQRITEAVGNKPYARY